MRRRLAALLLTLALPLAACSQVQPGAAVFIGDTRITTSDVEAAVQEVFADAEIGEGARANAAEVRGRVVEVLVLTELFRLVGEDVDVDVSTSDIDTASQLLAERPRQAWPADVLLVPRDVAAEYAARIQALGDHFGDEAGERAAERFELAVREQLEAHPVTVNPRYGTFDADTFALTTVESPWVRDLS